jgi:hypothetical protein
LVIFLLFSTFFTFLTWPPLLLCRSYRGFNESIAMSFKYTYFFPTKFPCGVCSKAVRKIQRGILCEDCIQWFHIKCIDLPVSEYNKLSTSDSWYCNPCTLPNFTDSFFDLDLSEESNTPNHDYVPSSSEETSGVNKNNCTRFKELRDARKLHPRNFITAYLNVNQIVIECCIKFCLCYKQ